MFGGGSSTPPAPQPAPPAPTVTDPTVVAQQQQQARETAEAQGRASTLLTSGMGDTSTAQVQRKMLLGS